ncbi:MAG TPA: response regulator [Chthoniobacteraceae bacterium]|jgi:signal transduction histidine kinase/DNA-binding response OmpR family regulator|nr:sensor hybrid histidine kinase [Chthoniobacter sp.]HEV7868354.1 response regulator [Chthoniobacteraceae bacterium]
MEKEITAARRDDHPSSKAPPSVEEKVNILIVDDRADKLLALDAAIAELNQNVVLARSGKEALRALLQQDFAVILLDVNMPGMDGFETAAMIRQRRRSEFTPIILVSAVNDTDNHVSRGYSLGAVDYILSPIIPEILRAKVSVFVDLFRKTAQIERQAEERAQFIRTEAARVEAETARERFAFLAEASNVLASSLRYEETFGNLARLIVPRLADYCFIDMCEADETVRTVAVAHRDPEQEATLREFRARFPVDLTCQSGLGYVLRTGSTEVCNDFAENEETRRTMPREQIEAIRALGVRSYLLTALCARGRILGALALIGTELNAFGEAEVAQAEELARRAALALDNASHYEAAQKAQHAAETANQAKDQFLAMLSHELRTPLTPVLMTIALLEDEPDFPEQFRPSLEVVRRNIQLEARLIDDLLDLTRVSKGKVQLKLETVDAHTVIRSALDICNSEIEDKKLSVDYKATGAAAWLRADAARLQQVFWNLVKNAVKFTPEGGRLKIRTQVRDQALEVQVIDTGIGIEAEVLPKIFNAFEQGTRSLSGLGLGLAISKALVSLHGGNISAASDGVGKGAAFRVVLPLAPAPAENSTAVAPDKVPERKRLRLLVVEDHPDTNRSLERLLTRRGYEVKTAFCVSEALEKSVAYRYDVLISDIGLPDGSGLSLVAELATQYSFRAIALSGFGMEDDLQSSKEAGFLAHLTKPVDIGELDLLIQRIAAEPVEAVAEIAS